MPNREASKYFLRKREYFRSGGIRGYYPAMGKGMTYVVESYSQPIAVFDGDVWHLLDSDFLLGINYTHLEWVKSVIGTHDAYSEYPVVPTKASMDALIERLTK